MLTEKSDVYSFGILIMELITGRRSPVDYSKPQGEVRNHHLHIQQLILLFIVFLFISSIVTSIVRSIYVILSVSNINIK